MLNFGKANGLFFFLLVMLIGVNFFAPIPWWAYLLLVFIYSLVIFYGCTFIQSNFFLPVICEAATTEKKIALSFDDGPANDHTPAILDILGVHGVEAAFFCIGRKVDGNNALLQRTIAEGHVVGNHSFSHHFLFDLFSSRKMIAELAMTDNEIMQRTGLTPRLFRPPYGVINPSLRKAILKRGYQTIGWSVRSFDTMSRDEQRLLNRLKASVHPGAIFLFHDTMEITKKILPGFIQYVKDQGYKIERLDKMLFLQAYA